MNCPICDSEMRINYDFCGYEEDCKCSNCNLYEYESVYGSTREMIGDYQIINSGYGESDRLYITYPISKDGGDLILSEVYLKDANIDLVIEILRNN